MSEATRGGWFRFSLRTMFVVVTGLCVWLGWESRVVRERKVVRQQLQAVAAFHLIPAEEWVARYPPGFPPPATARVSLVRRMLGDQAIQEIWYSAHLQGATEAELARVKRVFPEAEVRESLPEPCHPGCFPRGTLVATPQGLRAIERIEQGDVVSAVLASGELASAQVQSVFVTDNWLWQIETEAGPLLTTQTQPLCVAAGVTRQAGDLQPGETVLRYEEGAVREVKVLAVTPTERSAKVFNLVLGDSEIFIANGFLARSKPPRLPRVAGN